jgi:hypothetical protein
MLLVLVICTNGDEQKMVMNLELQVQQKHWQVPSLARANRANRAILVIAVASNWDSQEAGEGCSIRSSAYR